MKMKIVLIDKLNINLYFQHQEINYYIVIVNDSDFRKLINVLKVVRGKIVICGLKHLYTQ